MARVERSSSRPRRRPVAISRAVVVALLAVLVSTAHPRFLSATAGAVSDAKTALILYDNQEEPRFYAPTRKPLAKPPTDFGLAYARQLQTLLGHFSFASITVKPVQTYRAGELDRHAVVFFIGSPTKSRVPPALLDDIGSTSRTVAWLNGGLDRLAARVDLPRRYGFRFIGRDQRTYRAVFYKGARLDKGDPENFRIEVTDSSRAQVYATAVGDDGKAPYILRASNLWVVTDNPMAYAGPTDRYLAFADILHDIVGEDHPPQRSAVIRIEDISPLARPEQLRAVADLLYSRRIPFVISVIPFHVNPANQTHTSLSERPQLVEALHYMTARGGTVALHGSTHQYRGETADDFEFWDARYRRPIDGETEEYVARRIEDGLAEVFRNNLYPLLWETPHYAASALAYSVIPRYFTSVIEQRQALDDQRTSFFVPYLIKRDPYGQQVVPESLGFVPQDTQDPEAIIWAARAHLVVRDAIGGAFFHPFVRLEALQQIIDEVQALGYRYLDVRLLEHRVQFPEGAAATGSATIALPAGRQYLKEFLLDSHGQRTNESVGTERLTGVIRRSIRVPPRSIYVAQTSIISAGPVAGRPRGVVATLWSRLRASRHPPSGAAPQVEEARAAIFWDDGARGALAGDEKGLRSALSTVGMNTAKMPITAASGTNFSTYNLIVVPQAAARRLTPAAVNAIVRATRRGSRLITTGQSPLAEALGIQFTGRSVRVKVSRDRLAPTLQVTWPSPGDLAEFTAPDGADTLVEEQGSQRPIVVSAPLSQGTYMFFGSLFSAGPGYDRFPFAVHHIVRALGVGTRVRAETLEVFYDPGYRQNISIERLAVAWRQQGVRVVHAAAWAFYPRYQFDYRRLMRSAHANGILVYAWFALPHLTQDYWVKHPECREKDYAGHDARAAWRFVVALTDAKCRTEVGRIVRDILIRYDWDGVNFAEIYFEGVAGFEDARPLTPYHPSARRDFQQRYGFDPQDLFDPASRNYMKRNPQALGLFHEFRADWIVRLHRWALTLAEDVKKARPDGFEVVITAVDNLSMPALRRSLGVDMKRIIALRKRHDFALAVEDPAPMWLLPPRRYARIAHLYRRLLPDEGKLLIDINILPFRPLGQHDYPTDHQGGLEVLQMVASAANAGRVLLYAESTILEPDLALIPHALATVARKQQRGREWTITSPMTTAIALDASEKEVFVDGRPWPAFVRGRALLPPGTHTLSPRGGYLRITRLREQSMKLQKITAPEWQATAVPDGLELRYSSPTRAMVVVTRPPRQVLLDGQSHATAPVAGDDGYAVALPAGSHTVRLRSVETFTRVLDLAGFLVALSIGSFGTLGISLLLLISMPRLIRRRGNARR